MSKILGKTGNFADKTRETIAFQWRKLFIVIFCCSYFDVGCFCYTLTHPQLIMCFGSIGSVWLNIWSIEESVGYWEFLLKNSLDIWWRSDFEFSQRNFRRDFKNHKFKVGLRLRYSLLFINNLSSHLRLVIRNRVSSRFTALKCVKLWNEP
jgi:hypothetical protein